jgi:CxxC motif-containing protein (DUF1111 family)
MRDLFSSEPRLVRRALATAVAVVYGVVFLGAQGRAPRPGDPLAGVSTAEFAEFRLGLDDFLEVETADEGLGPAFNGTSCAICHNIPSVGGFGTIAEVRAVGRNEQGELTPLYASGETLHQLFSVPTHGCQVSIPAEAAVIARRIPIPLFGAGLVEAIADASIVALEDPVDGNGDGVSGRAARIVDLDTGQIRIGRFGWKAQHATLITFGADAYRNEMGITNDLFPDELASGVSPDRMRLCDPIPDPEDIRDLRTNRRGIDNFASFMRFLAPLARQTPDAAARSGEQVFTTIGCASCHVPVLTTGRNPNRLFDSQAVALFSDLLLHDIGTGDGIAQGAALASEIRTPALWGLRTRRPLLHDGSATTIEEAIVRHAAEAAGARAAFARLSDPDKAALLAFLKTL